MNDDEVEMLASRHTIEADAWASDGAIHDLATFHRRSAAALRSLLAEREKLRAALDEARLQVEYLHGKFVATGSGNAVLARINAALDTAP